MKSALAGRGSSVLITAEPGHGQRAPACASSRSKRVCSARPRWWSTRPRSAAPTAWPSSSSTSCSPRSRRRRAPRCRTTRTLARFLPRPQGRERPAPHRSTAAASIRAKARLRTQQRAARVGFERLSRETPLLIAVHSLQRADDSSASLLAALATARRRAACCWRSPAIPTSRPRRRTRSPTCARWPTSMPLRGLTLDEVRALVTATFGEIPQHRAPGQLAARADLGQAAGLPRPAAAPDRAGRDPLRRRRLVAAAGAVRARTARGPRAGARPAHRAAEPDGRAARARAVRAQRADPDRALPGAGRARARAVAVPRADRAGAARHADRGRRQPALRPRGPARGGAPAAAPSTSACACTRSSARC